MVVELRTWEVLSRLEPFESSRCGNKEWERRMREGRMLLPHRSVGTERGPERWNAD